MSQLQVTGEAKIRDLQGPVVANSGVISALDGAANQYVRGDGSLANFPTSTGGGSSVSYYLNGSVNQGTFGGSTYYQLSNIAITGTGTNFSTSANGLIAQFITDVNNPDATSVPSGNWNIEFYLSVSASSGALASFYVEIYKYNGTTFTLLATNVATPEFLTGTTTTDAYFTSVAFPETVLATTDRLAVKVYANVASKTVTLYTENNRLAQIVTTFSKGILSLNNLTDQQQFFATGTSGTDFNIASSIDTHTFNIPSASASNRGLITTGTQSIAGVKTFLNSTIQEGLSVLKNDAFQIIPTGYTGLTGYGLGGLTIIQGDGTTIYNSDLKFPSTSNRQYTFPAASGTIALTSNLSSYVPYSGATGNVDLGASNNLSANNITSVGYLKSDFGLLLKSGLVTTETGYLNISAQKISGNSQLNLYTDTGFYFSLSAPNSANYLYTFPASSGTVALTSNLSSYLSLAGGTLTGKLTINTGGVDDQLQVVGSAPSFRMTNAVTGATINGFIAMAGATNNYISGSLAGDMCIGNQNNGKILFGFGSGTAVPKLSIDASGNAAFSGALSGTSATFSSSVQAATMSIGIAPQTDKLFVYNASGTNTGVTIQQDGTGDIFRANGNSGANRFSISQSGAATFSSSVGIGVSPVSGYGILQVNASASYTTIASLIKLSSGANSYTNRQSVFEFGQGGTNPNGYSHQISASTAGTAADNTLNFALCNGGETTRVNVLTLLGSGNVGIGTSSPSAKLSVNANAVGLLANISDGIAETLQISTGSGYVSFLNPNSGVIAFRDSTNAVERMRITSGGDVLVNSSSTSSGAKFNVFFSDNTNNGQVIREITGNASVGYLIFNSNGTQTGSITRVGSTAAVLYNTTSDYRLKEDLKEVKGLEKLSKLKVYDFKWIGTNERMDGVIAHELQEILPYAVNGEKDALDKEGIDSYQGVDYSKIVPILIKAVQELKQEIETLKNK